MRSSGPRFLVSFLLGALLAGCNIVVLPPAPPPGVAQVVSTDNSGNAGNGVSGQPALSATGRFLAFDSTSTNLVTPNTTQQDVFLHDSCVGSGGCAAATILASAISGASREPNFISQGPASISADGRFVAFVSFSSNLVTPNAAHPQAYLHDTCAGAPTGCVPQTFFALTSTTGGEPNQGTDVPAMSSTGRFVASRTFATNLVPGVSNAGLQLYLHDNCRGVPPVACNVALSNTIVSVDNSGNPSNGVVGAFAAVSADGRFVAFNTNATNLVPRVPSGVGQIYLRDTCIGAANCTPGTTLVSVDSAGNPGFADSFVPAISDDGRFIVFTSNAALVAADANGVEDVYLRDTCNSSSGPVGGCTPSTSLISVAMNGTAADSFSANTFHAISANGRFVVFESNATNLVLTSVPTGQSQIFVRDTCFSTANCTPKTVLISVGQNGIPVGGVAASISADGHFAAFAEIFGPNGGQNLLARTGF